MKQTITFFLLLFHFSFLFSAEPDIKLYNSEDGFSANFINDIVADKDDNIWLATNTGLKKFDGYNFINYKIPNFNKKEIKKLILFNNLLYILYKEGTLITLDLNTSITKKITSNRFLDFYVTSQKIILLKQNFNIEVLEGKRKVNYILKFSKKIPLQDSEVSHAIISYNNVIYFSIPSMGLFQLKKNKIETLKTDKNITPTGFRERFKVINNQLYFIGLFRPLLIEKNNTIKKIDFINPDKKKFSVTDFTNNNSIDYFIRNDNSLIIESKGKASTIIDKLKNVELRKIFFLGKNLFVTSNKGLYKIIKKNSGFRNLNLNNAVLVKRKIIEDGNRIIFFGYPNIVSLQNNNITKLGNHYETTYDAVKVKNNFYITTDGKGLAKADENFKHIILLKKDFLKKIICVYYDSVSDLIYFGDNEFLYYKKPDSKITQKIPSAFKGFSIKSIIKDNKYNRLFVGTENGVFILNPKNKKISKLITNKIIGDLLIDTKNNLLYIGYDNGFLIYNLYNLKLVKSVAFNFLKNPRVTSLLEDNHGRIWGSTYSGLFAYDNTNNNLLELNKSDLINKEYNYKSACKLKNGDLIFGGLDGYDVITPSKFDFSNSEIYGRVSGYHIIKPNDSIYYGQNNPVAIKFKNKNEYLRIYISTTNAVNKEKCSFQYKLDNTNWIEMQQQYIDLVGLAKGNYVLQIKGQDNKGKIIKFNPININVNEDFYKSDSFVFALIFLLLVFIIIFSRTGYNRLKLKNEIYEKISMDLHDEVGTILSKTSLLISQNKKIEKEHLTRIQNNIKQANFGLRTNINSIKENNIELAYLYYECIEVMESFLNIKNIHYIHSFSGNKNKKISKSLYKDLKLCFYEIFNNAIKYSETEDIEVTFFEEKNILTITVLEKDNYVNFNEITYGNGIKNIEKRVERNNGEINYINDKENNSYTIFIKIKL